MRDLARWRGLLAALWLGALLTVVLIATPAPFATLARADAGRVVTRVLANEAYLSLAMGVVLLLIERAAKRPGMVSGEGSALSPDLWLVLGTLFCTVAGYFGIQPLMADARVGLGRLSFGQLHAVSGGFFMLKLALVAALAWRFSRQPSSSS